MLAAAYVISCPLSVPTTTKKRFYLNLNQYRNAHHFTLAKAKVNFHEMMAQRVKHLPQFDTVNLIFTLYPGTEQLVDTSNVCSIVDKFFSDVLVKCHKIKDDNRKIVLSVVYRYGEIDRLNPRVDVSISPGEIAPGLVAVDVAVDQPKREEPMQITINQAEIEKAIEARIRSQIMVREGFKIDIDLKATRGPEGYQAVIDIVEDSGSATSTGVGAVANEVKAERASAPATSAPKATRPKAVTKGETPPKAKAPEPQPEPEVAEAKAEDTVEPTEPAVEPVAEPVAEAAVTPVAAVEAEAEPDMSAEADAAGETAATAAAAVAEEAEGQSIFSKVAGAAQADVEESPPAARPSLFGNLGAPKNS
jgi:hypothetical protein